jgi:subtilisin family serine protease
MVTAALITITTGSISRTTTKRLGAAANAALPSCSAVGLMPTLHRSLSTSLSGSHKLPHLTAWQPYDSDEDGHGTHVTGLAAGANGIGVAPEAKWVHACACNFAGYCRC